MVSQSLPFSLKKSPSARVAVGARANESLRIWSRRIYLFVQPQLFHWVGSPARFAARLRKYLRGETAGGVARCEQHAAGMEGKSCLNWLWPRCWSVSSCVFGANGGVNFIEILIVAMGKVTSLSQAHNRKKTLYSTRDEHPPALSLVKYFCILYELLKIYILLPDLA